MYNTAFGVSNPRSPLGAGVLIPLVKGICLTEEEGFEPPVRFRTAVFKTATLSRSVTPPAV